jgi:hypothetical protein
MIDAITQSFLDNFRADGLKGDPCDEWEVRDLEQSLGIIFPAAYRAFLLCAGHGFAPFEGAQYALEDDFGQMQGSARRIMKDRLPDDAFAFFVHQGFVVRFFCLNDGDDPAVYEYVEYYGKPQIAAARLSLYFSPDMLFEEL